MHQVIVLDEPYDPPAYRAFAEEYFAVGKFLARANELLAQLEAVRASAKEAGIEPAACGEPADDLEPARQTPRPREGQCT